MYFTTKAMVFRMDILPETEQLHIMKIGAFGLPYSRIVDIKRLERINHEKDTTYALRWIKQYTWIPKEDKNLVYRSMDTGEIFTFSLKGVWNKEGLEHELLN